MLFEEGEVPYFMQSVLITGGTGSFGRALVRQLVERSDRWRRIVVLSRDELKQFEMQQEFPASRFPQLRYFIGDVRDAERLRRAFDGVDAVVHAAALKQVPAAEYNPFEAVKTNVLGAENVINAALDSGVTRVIALSTDKAANPINLYGATKLCSDKLFVAGNSYSGSRNTRFSVVRYGNVVGSRGSVVPFFLARKSTGVLPITDPRMTRFWITLEQGVAFVLSCLDGMTGGEIFVPKLPSMRITDLAAAIAPECETEVVGIRPGEKIHETLISVDDARQTVDAGDRYVIQPAFHWWDANGFSRINGYASCPDGFAYTSDSNSRWLTANELRDMIEGF
jgi:UDP-N-acetylglucosamine 4,6-dehydratase